MRSSEATWAARVRAWRESGKDVHEFSAGQAYAPSTLRWWASRLKRLKKTASAPPPKTVAMARIVRTVRREPVSVEDASLVVEVAGARIVVRSGFDTRLLRDVVSALGGAR